MLFFLKVLPSACVVPSPQNGLAALQVPGSSLNCLLGIATLPYFAGDAHEDLVRCLPSIAELDNEQWLVVREEIRSTPYVRAFVDALAEYIR